MDGGFPSRICGMLGSGAVGALPWKAEAIVGSGGVAHQRARGDGILLRVLALRDFPGLEDRVDVLIEPEFSILNGLQGRHGRNRLTDGRSLEHCLRIGWRARLHIRHAPCLGPLNLEVADDGDAHGGNVCSVDELRQRELFEPLAVGDCGLSMTWMISAASCAKSAEPEQSRRVNASKRGRCIP